MSNKKVAAVLFDLDGTLLDTAPDFVTTLQVLMQRHNRPQLGDNAIRQTVSHGARALVKLGFDLSEANVKFEPLRLELLSIYQDTLADRTALFDGMEDVLQELEQQRIPWGIVTNKPSLYANKILAALKLDTRSAATICPDHVTNTKPDPEPMFLACSQINVIPQNVIYVGDHRRDIEAGTNANMTTVAASYGYIDPNDPVDTWNADYTINHPLDLLPLIKQLQN